MTILKSVKRSGKPRKTSAASSSYKTPLLISRYFLDIGSDLLEAAIPERSRFDLLLDSGAFTAHSLGFSYDVNDYIEWVKTTSIKPDRFIQLDVIGDEKATVENLKMMLDADLEPIPVFTRGSQLETLEQIYDLAPLIATGGLVGTQKRTGYVKWLMKSIQDRPVHWLGFTALDFIAKYRPASCDSSGWLATRMYGQLQVYLGKGKWKIFRRQDFIKRPTLEFQRIFTDYEIDTASLAYETGWRIKGNKTSTAHLIATRSWARYVLDVKKKYGTDIYSVIMLPLDLMELLNAFDWAKEKFHGAKISNPV